MAEISTDLQQNLALAETSIGWLQRHERYFSRELNGYSRVPYGPYTSTLHLINQDGKIIDLGCGNGMLLKYASQFSGHKLIPFGIDISEMALEQAVNEIFPNHKENFHLVDVNQYGFAQGKFNLIITNPFYAKDMGELTDKCLDNLEPGGRIIYRVHDDVLRINRIQSLDEVSALKGYNMKTSNGNWLVFGVIDKNS